MANACNPGCDQAQPWIVDSEASGHMTGDVKLLTHYRKCIMFRHVTIAVGKAAQVISTGTIKMNLSLTLKKVLHVQHLKFNILSVEKLITKTQLSCIFLTH